MNKQIQNQMESITDEVSSHFIDAYYCYDWNMSATEFACLLIAEIQKRIVAVAHELDNPNDE